MRGVRDKADFCCDYSRIEDLLLFRIWVVIAHQKLQQKNKTIVNALYVHRQKLSQQREGKKNMTILLRKAAI